MKTEPNENAFPVNQSAELAVREWGLTKREYFAAMAMQALATNPTRAGKDCAFWAVSYADDLIEQLNK